MRIDMAKAAQVLSMVCEGMSINAALYQAHPRANKSE